MCLFMCNKTFLSFSYLCKILGFGICYLHMFCKVNVLRLLFFLNSRLLCHIKKIMFLLIMELFQAKAGAGSATLSMVGILYAHQCS